MVIALRDFKRMSEGLKAYKRGQKISHFTKADEKRLADEGYVEIVKTEKKEGKPQRKKAVKK